MRSKYIIAVFITNIYNSIYNKYLLKISVFIRKCAMTEKRQSEQPSIKDGELRNNTTNMQN